MDNLGFGRNGLKRRVRIELNPWINLCKHVPLRLDCRKLSEYLIGGGFISRCIFVYAPNGKLVAYPSAVLPPELRNLKEAHSRSGGDIAHAWRISTHTEALHRGLIGTSNLTIIISLNTSIRLSVRRAISHVNKPTYISSLWYYQRRKKDEPLISRIEHIGCG